MSALSRPFCRVVLLGAAATALANCTEAEPTVGRFERTGELVALSGGDAGARGACITCHGLRGEGDGNLVPRLAGLNPGYITRQLEFFSQGQRRHPQMVWIAGHLDWPSRQKVAAYYAAMPIPAVATSAEALPEAACTPAVARLYHRGDPDRGIVSCAACHGDDGRGVGQGNPPLADQPAPYLAAQLHHWRGGKRYGDPLGAMGAISRLLREEEIAPLAAYASLLSDPSRNPALPEACLRIRRPAPRNGA
jgi:cytochrome c553